MKTKMPQNIKDRLVTRLALLNANGSDDARLIGRGIIETLETLGYAESLIKELLSDAESLGSI